MARTGKLRLGVAATGTALVLALGLLTLVGTGPSDAASRYKIVTRTFSSTQPITIPGTGGATATAAPYPSEILVGGLRRGKVLDANLTLKNLSHDYPSDLDVLLSHRGVNRTVMSDVGSIGAHSLTLKLDDEAESRLPGDAQLFSGTFKPTNLGTEDAFPDPAPFPSGRAALSGFDGSDPNGTWKLRVVDDVHGDGGEFAGGWSVTIKARVLR